MRDGLLIFTLVELDQDNRENSLNEEIKTELLSELSANGGTINEAKIEALLKGNDLLGVKLVKMNEIAAATDTAVTFTGSKLMDKYNYILGWKLF
jgi:hypothetical protein